MGPVSPVAFGEERRDCGRLVLGHRPQSIGTDCRRVAEQACSLSVAREFVRDLVRDEVRFRHEHAEWFFGLLPTVEALNPARVGDGDHDLDRHHAEAALIGTRGELRDGPHSDGLSPEQFVPVSLEVRAQEVPLELGLLDGGRDPLLGPVPDAGADSRAK